MVSRGGKRLDVILRRRWQRLLRCRVLRDDAGFTLLEMMVAIVIITIVMTALTSLFVTSTASTDHLRARQAATALLTSALDEARGVDHAAVVDGRSAARVGTRFAAFDNTPVAPWLATMDQAIDTNPETMDADPALPTQARHELISGRTYAIDYFVGTCARLAFDLPTSVDCTNSAPIDGSTADDYVTFRRVVVAVSWQDRGCDGGTCYEISAVLLNADRDPLFNFNTDPPPEPTLSNCRDQVVVIDESVDTAVYGRPKPGVPPAICDLSGGVPSFSWIAEGLPDGLSLDQNAHIRGVAVGPAGTTSSTITVRDAFGRESSDSFDWTIYDGLNFAPVDNVETFVDEPIDPIVLAVSGGSGEYTISDNGTLPTGLTLDGDADSGYQITGTPTATGYVTVGLTATDTVTDQAVTRQFVIMVLDPAPTISSPGDQVSRVGRPFSITLTSTCPTESCTVGWNGGSASVDWNLDYQTESGDITVSGTAPPDPYTVTGLVIGISAGEQHAETEAFDWRFIDGPILQGPDDQISHVSTAITGLDVRGDCGESDPCTYALSGQPAGMTIDQNTGMISWTTPPNPVTVTDITVSMTDDAGQSATASFDWVVHQQPTIGAIDAQTWRVGAPIEAITATITCTWEPCAVSLDGSLPAGLGYDATAGTISGIPTTVGTGSATITVTDGGGATASTTLAWTVESAELTLSYPDQRTSPSSTRGWWSTCQYDSTGSLDLLTGVMIGGEPVDSTDGLTFTVTTDPSAGWLTFDNDHLITVVAPCNTDATTVTVTVTDSAGGTDSDQFTWTITEPTVTIRSAAYPSYCLQASAGRYRGPSVDLDLATFCSQWTIPGDGTIRTTIGSTEYCLVGANSGAPSLSNFCGSSSAHWVHDSQNRLVWNSNRYLQAQRSSWSYSLRMVSTSSGTSVRWTVE